MRISPRPVRVRKRASPGRGNAPGKTIGRSVRKTAGRYDRRVHPRAKLPDRVVPWVLRLLRSCHPPRNENRFGGEGSSAGAFHYANFVHAAASNIHPAIGSCRHIPHRTAARGNIRPCESFRLRIELDDRIRLHSGLAVPNQSVWRNRDSIRSRFRAARRFPHLHRTRSQVEPP